MVSNNAIPWKRNLFLLWIGQLLGFVGYSAAIPFIPLYMKYELGMDTQEEMAKALTAFHICSTLCLAVISPVWGWVADRYGRKLMLLRAYFANSFIFPLMGFCIPISIYINKALGVVGLGAWATPFGVLLVTRILASCFSGSANAAQALIVSTTPDEHQGFALGVFSTATWSGQMAGLVVGSVVVDTFGYKVAFLTLGATYFISGIINLFVKEQFVRQQIDPEKAKNKSRWNFSGYTASTVYLLFFLMLAAMGKNMETEYLSLKVDSMVGHDLAIRWTAYVSAASAIGGIIAGFMLGKLTDKCRPMQLLIPLLALSGAFGLAQGASRDLTVFGVVIPGIWLLIASRFLAFVATGGIEPVLQRLLSRITPKERRGGVFGFAMTCRMLGTMFGSMASGAIYYFWGADTVFYGGGVLFVLVMPLVIGIFPLIKRQFPDSMKSGSELAREAEAAKNGEAPAKA